MFAAQPLEKELGIALTSAPKVPAAVEQRLAALEAKQSSAGKNAVSKQTVDGLAAKVASAEARLAKFTKLEQQVAALADDVKKSQAEAAKSSTSGAPNSSTATGNAAKDGQKDGEAADNQSAALRTRLSKLESALATLSSATTSSGRPSRIASLAKFSAKFADLESSVGTQLKSLRKDLLTEMDTRVTGANEAATKAATGSERLDREVADIKTDTARLEQRSTVLKTASDKLAATLRAVGEQAANLKVELDALKGDVKQELTKVSRPDDVKQALAPVSEKVAAIEKNLGSVIASETARKENAERIVLSLELSNLKRVLDRGAPYATELADVKKIAGSEIDFGALDAHMSSGVPSSQELTRQFRKVAYKIINAEDTKKDASRIDKLLAAAKSIVQVRRTDIPVSEKTAEAEVARIEKHLKDGDLSGALALAEKLPEQAKTPAKGWISQLAARANVDRAISKIEDQLKASLGGGAPEKKS